MPSHIELENDRNNSKDQPVFHSNAHSQLHDETPHNHPTFKSRERQPSMSRSPLFEGYIPSLSASFDSVSKRMSLYAVDNSEGTEIFLVIYDLSSLNVCLSKMGIAAYHSTVRIFSVELGYGSHDSSSTGVFELDVDPKSKTSINALNQTEKNTLPKTRVISMGLCKKSYHEMDAIIEELKMKYIGCQYDLIKHNCNHFSEDLCFKLLGKHIPKYVNRIANLGRLVRCLIPKKILENRGGI